MEILNFDHRGQSGCWAALLAVFVVVELATANLVTIWFAVGALAALLASLATNMCCGRRWCSCW